MRTALPCLLTFVLLTGLSRAEQKPCSSIATDTEDSQPTTAQLVDCGTKEYREADVRLNAAYTKVIADMKEDLDRAEKEHSREQQSYDQRGIRNLRAAERAWIQYRDLHCSAAKQRYEGGTISPVVWLNCMTQLTEHRTAELEEGYEQDPK
jgi:uncharacterized protein YecT (DUF1311 family)